MAGGCMWLIQSAVFAAQVHSLHILCYAYSLLSLCEYDSNVFNKSVLKCIILCEFSYGLHIIFLDFTKPFRGGEWRRSFQNTSQVGCVYTSGVCLFCNKMQTHLVNATPRVWWRKGARRTIYFVISFNTLDEHLDLEIKYCSTCFFYGHYIESFCNLWTQYHGVLHVYCILIDWTFLPHSYCFIAFYCYICTEID